MHYLLPIKLWLESNVHPAAPYALLTLAIWGFYLATRKFTPGLWVWLDAHSPENVIASKLVQGLPAVLMGALAVAYSTGLDFGATWKGALAGALAPVMHELMKRYRGGVAEKKPPTVPPAAIATLMLCFLLPGCAAFKPAARTVNDLARDACAMFFSSKQGISVEDAARGICRAREVLDPFIEELLAAQQRAGTKASAAQSSPSADAGP